MACGGLLQLVSLIESIRIRLHVADLKKICTLIEIKVQFSSVLSLNRRVLRIIVTNLYKIQFMQFNVHKYSRIY